MSAHYDLKPYRIEWQFSTNVNWVPVTSCDSHDEAMTAAEEHVEKYDGYCRVISQHVIHRTKHGAQSAKG